MGTSFVTPNTEASIMARLLDLRTLEITPAVAEFLLTLRFPDEDVARMNNLSDLAQRDLLDADRQAELDSYIHVSNLLALMQSRARRLLGSQAPSC